MSRLIIKQPQGINWSKYNMVVVAKNNRPCIYADAHCQSVIELAKQDMWDT